MDRVTFSLAQAAQGPGIIETLLLFGTIPLIWYFLVIRPQLNQEKQKQALIQSIKKGDEVLLSSGIYGRVAEVLDNDFVVEIADKVKVKVARSAVGDLVRPPEATNKPKA